ncbi:MAG: hypothetical protein F4Z34_08445 [Acidimicrobiaceae bacterium]|nr:hypothetical protein [Acidimicrobiaceae bacterium]
MEQVKDRSHRWTIHKLDTEGVLATAKAHIEQGRRFRFLTSSDAAELETLADQARVSESFADYEELLSGRRRTELESVADRWGVSPERARSVLRDIEVEHEPVRSLERFIKMRLQIWYADRAETVSDALESFCETHIHEYLTAQQVMEHLESRGLQQQPRAGDTGGISRLRQSRQRHQTHVQQFEPPGGLVPTEDVDAVVGMLRDPDGKQILVVEGRAGSGKSTVAAAAAAAQEESGWCVGAVRMDVPETMLTSDALGRAMELTESPSVLLAVVSDGQPALLVVDQLDAVSLLSGRVPDSFDAVNDVLLEIERYPNVKVLLACRTVDLENDQRLCSLRDSERVGRHAVSELDIETVKAHLAACGIDPPEPGPAIELLRTPLHLSLFTRLSDEGRALRYVTLQQLFARYTQELRSRVGRIIGSLNWAQTAGAMVDYMSREGTVAAPSAVLDEASQQEVEALVSESVIVRHGAVVTFFHESYFDYLFAVSFVGAGRDLQAFLVSSDQDLFRRAQTRQVLEYLAATDQGRFMSVAVGLLQSDDVRYHLKTVVVAVLRSFIPTPEDWRMLEDLAWCGSPVGDRVRTLLSQPGWFDAADRLGRWEVWLDDSRRAEAALYEAAVSSRHRAVRTAELLRTRIDGSVEWGRRLRWMLSWSLSSELVDLAAAVIEAGLFDGADAAVGGGEFWMILHRLENDDPAGTARLIGAFLGRGLVRAQQAGGSDPFESGHLSADSHSDSVITNAARKAPAAFIEHVLLFVAEVATANQHHTDEELPRGRRWGHRYVSPNYGVDQIVFSATESALRKLAEDNPSVAVDALASLREADSAELRFLACRTLTGLPDADDAINWIVSDTRNLALGWSDSPYWASRELIEQHSPACSDDLFQELQSAILDFWPGWEGSDHRGHSQCELLSVLDATRLSLVAARQLDELQDRFSDWPPEPPRPAVWTGGSHVDIGDAEHMSDEDWLGALRQHTSDAPYVGDDGPVVGAARAAARMLGEAARNDPPRFSSLALSFSDDIPSAAINEVIRNVQDSVDADALADVCEHAHSLYGSEAGRAVCSAIGRAGSANTRLVALLGIYAQDVDPAREEAQTVAVTREPGGWDLLTTGMNSTRGQAALSAAAVLYATADHVNVLTPVIEILAQDDVDAVRACAADAVNALGNHSPDRALDLVENIFDNAIDILDAPTSERLLTRAVVCDPDRFGPTLAQALARPDNVAKRAGRIWAVARWHEQLPASITTDARALPVAARRGAAAVFASSVADSLDDLRDLLDDDDREVQQEVGLAMRRLDQVPTSEREGLIDALMASAAFPTHMRDLMGALERMPSDMPSNTIDVCERVVGIDGADLADPTKSSALTGRDLIAVVLRLYRHGDHTMRARCLNIIDKLAEFNLYDLEEALQDER